VVNLLRPALDTAVRTAAHVQVRASIGLQVPPTVATRMERGLGYKPAEEG
jgi:hypothetical protein